MIQIFQRLAHLTGLTSEELEARLNEAGEEKHDATFADLVKEKYAEQIAKAREEGRKRGVKEKATTIEKAASALFTEHGISATVVEEGLVQLAEKLNSGDPGKTGGELTAEALRGLPQYKQAFESDTAALRARVEAAEAKAAEVAAAQERQARLAALRPVLKKQLEERCASFGVGEDAAFDVFFSRVPPDRFRVEGDTVTVLGEDNEPVKDEFHNPVKLADYLEKTWVFGFNSQQPAQTPAPPTRGGTPPAKFESQEAYTAAYEAALKRGDRAGAAALTKAFLATDPPK